MNGYSRPSTKVLPPAPPEFMQVFVKGGWRLVEHLYGARTDRLLKWRELVGAAALDELRRQRMRGDDTALDRARQADERRLAGEGRSAVL